MKFWKHFSLHLYFLFLFEDFKTNFQTNLIQNSLFYSPLNTHMYDITLQTNVLIASDESVLFWSQTLWCCRQTHFVLEINILVLETNELKISVRTSVIHTQLATSDYKTKLMSRWLLVTATVPLSRKLTIECEGLASVLRVIYEHACVTSVYCLWHTRFTCASNVRVRVTLRVRAGKWFTYTTKRYIVI